MSTHWRSTSICSLAHKSQRQLCWGPSTGDYGLCFPALCFTASSSPSNVGLCCCCFFFFLGNMTFTQKLKNIDIYFPKAIINLKHPGVNYCVLFQQFEAEKNKNEELFYCGRGTFHVSNMWRMWAHPHGFKLQQRRATMCRQRRGSSLSHITTIGLSCSLVGNVTRCWKPTGKVEK